jgi:hypothetical protein
VRTAKGVSILFVEEEDVASEVLSVATLLDPVELDDSRIIDAAGVDSFEVLCGLVCCAVDDKSN